MRRSTIIVGLMALSTYSYGQRDLKTEVKDFNMDGYADTMITYYAGGSGHGGRYAEVIDGRTRQHHAFNTSMCFCQFWQSITLPKALCIPENREFREQMMTRLLPEKKEDPDPSFSWLLSAFDNHVELTHHPYFDQFVYPVSNWNSGEFQMPTTYYLQSSELASDSIEIQVYYGHNHFWNPSGDSITKVGGDSVYQIFRTSHGVFATRDNEFKWLFISDVETTGAPEKLRWESIGHVTFDGKYLLLRNHMAPLLDYSVYLINFETGAIGRMKDSFSEYSGDDHEMPSYDEQKERMVEETQVPFHQLCLELDALYDNQNNE